MTILTVAQVLFMEVFLRHPQYGIRLRAFYVAAGLPCFSESALNPRTCYKLNGNVLNLYCAPEQTEDSAAAVKLFAVNLA